MEKKLTLSESSREGKGNENVIFPSNDLIVEVGHFSAKFPYAKNRNRNEEEDSNFKRYKKVLTLFSFRSYTFFFFCILEKFNLWRTNPPILNHFSYAPWNGGMQG
jgi:hypothetical protein